MGLNALPIPEAELRTFRKSLYRQISCLMGKTVLNILKLESITERAEEDIKMYVDTCSSNKVFITTSVHIISLINCCFIFYEYGFVCSQWVLTLVHLTRAKFKSTQSYTNSPEYIRVEVSQILYPILIITMCKIHFNSFGNKSVYHFSG